MKIIKWNSIGDAIRFLRSQNKYTQECLSDDSNIAVSTLERIENGKTNPRIDNLIVILDNLGYRLEIVSKNEGELCCVIEYPEKITVRHPVK